jgi:hypothetical protein
MTPCNSRRLNFPFPAQLLFYAAARQLCPGGCSLHFFFRLQAMKVLSRICLIDFRPGTV